MNNTLKEIKLNLGKIALLVAFLGLLLLSFSSGQMALLYGLAIFFTLFFFFRRELWVGLVLAIPLLTIGTVMSLPVTGSWNYELTITEAVLLIVFVVMVFGKWVDGKFGEIKLDMVAVFLGLYTLLSLASYAQIVDLKYYFFGLKAVVFSFLSYTLAINLLDSKAKLKAFMWSLTASLLILSGQIFYKLFILGFSSKFFFERKLIILPIGPLATAAAVIVLLLAPVLTFAFDSRWRERAVILPIFALGVFAMFISLGKAAILSFIIAIIYLFIKLKDKRWWFLGTVIAFGIVSAVFLAPVASGLITRVQNTMVDTNTKFRVLEYQTAGKIVAEHFWFGVGSGQQLYYFKKLLNYDTSELVNNFFLQSLLDLGVFGLAGVTMIFLATLKKISQNDGRLYGESTILGFGFVAMMLAALLNGLLEVTFFALQYAIVFWLSVGAYASLKNYPSTSLRTSESYNK